MFKQTRSLSNASLSSRPCNSWAVKLNKTSLSFKSLLKPQHRTKHEVDWMMHCWVMAIWSFSHSDRTSEIGHACDFIFCPMLLCSALDRQWRPFYCLICMSWLDWLFKDYFDFEQWPGYWTMLNSVMHDSWYGTICGFALNVYRRLFMM